MSKLLDRVMPTIKSVIAAAFGSQKAIKCCATVLAVTLAVSCNFLMADKTVAYNVSLNGQVIATVKSKQVLTDALEIVDNRVSGSNVKAAVGNTGCTVAIAPPSVLESENTLADHIIENSDDIVMASELFVDGSSRLLAATSQISDAILARKSSFMIDGADCTAEFVEDIELHGGYFLKSEIDSQDEVDSVINSLTVKTTANVVTEIVTGYKSVTQKTSTKPAGYSAVTTAGQNGITRVTERVVTVNGEECERTAVSSEVVSAPVNEVVTVGTARSSSAAKANQAAKNVGFIFPLPSGSWKVSSYYGDGRNHKGVDLCASKGTAIYAVASGTVTKSTYHKSFGYYVEIDHGNGISTLYAHASALCVSVGTRVNAGEVVALVGNTGNSYGNHLHFEVRVGSSRVNPAPYIGL